MLRPVFTSEKEMENAIPKEYFGDFKNKVYDFQMKIEMVKEAASVYILNNWEKIDDWSDCNVTVVSYKKKVTYYNHKDKDRQFADNPIGRMLKQTHDEQKEMHNPMKTVSKVVLDPTDGDFSMDINDTEHVWISEGVIEIADYIENKIKEKNNGLES